MTNKQVQALLSNYPDNMEVKLRVEGKSVIDFSADSVLLSSETAYVNADAPEDEWDCEDGKIELGEGKQYLLLNPIIV